MKWAATLLVAVVALSASTFWFFNRPSEQRPFQCKVPTERPAATASELEAIALEYAIRTKHWTRDQFIVCFEGRNENMWEVWVLTKADHDRTGVVGGGSSFAAIINPDTRRVEKELRFQ